ncbi:proteasome component M29, partial [Coemansia javaensis]
IIGLLGQINKKLKGRDAVVLPVAPLLESTFSKGAGGFSQSFRLMYISMAVDAGSEQQLAATIPFLLRGICTRPQSQQAMLNTSLLTAVWRGPVLSEDQLRALDLVGEPARAEALVAIARDVFLFNGAGPRADGSSPPVPAGLCEGRVSVLMNGRKAPWASGGPALQQLKQRLLHIIGSGVAYPTEMPDRVHEQRLLALVCASSDPYFQQVADGGKDALKRMRPVDVESPTFVDAAFAMFLGGPSDASGEERRSPAAAAVRLKLLAYLERSMLAVSVYPRWTHVALASLFSAESTARLRQRGMGFLLWAVNNTPSDQIVPAVAPVRELVQRALSEAASTSGASSAGDDVLRGAAYVALGALGRRAPPAALDGLGQLQMMFEALAVESAGVRISIQEGLLAMLPGYQAHIETDAAKQRLLRLLQDQLSSLVYQARYCALRYAISAFPLASMEARWLCILALADSKPEIQRLASSGLLIKPGVVLDRSSEAPAPCDALPFMCDRASEIVGGQPALAVANARVYGGILDFGRSVLLAAGAAASRAAKGKQPMDPTELEFVNDCSALASEFQRGSMRLALAGLDAAGTLAARWLEAVCAVLEMDRLFDPALLRKALLYLVELVSLGPLGLSLALFSKADLLLARLGARDVDAQLHAAQALSVAYAMKLLDDLRADRDADGAFWNERVVAQLGRFAADARAPTQPRLLDAQQGAILALGCVSYGLCVSQRASGKSWADAGLGPLGAAVAEAQASIAEGVRLAGDPATHATVAAAWCVAASKASQMGRLAGVEGCSATWVLEVAADVLKGAGSTQVYDAALSLLSDAALGEPGMAVELIRILRDAAKSATKKQLDVHFRTGEALARAVGRFECTLAALDWVFPIGLEAVYGADGAGANVEGVDALLDTITASMARSTITQERQAAAIWALALVQSCPGLGALDPWLAKLHACMSMLLSDRSELTQEVASRALGLIYNRASAALKEDMVYSLMALFGGGSKRPGADGDMANVQQALHRQIQSNEPLLEQESLGQTPDGHAVNTTYKSILSLASDMQNPSLVYQFMQLATHTAMWNSRCGAAYGVASIIEQARDAIQPHMAAMVPKLYRYTFDPSPQTQAAMKGIWSALLGPGSRQGSADGEEGPPAAAGTSSSIVERHWDGIIDECLRSMGQREWKDRESGCSALASAVSGADPGLVVPYLDRIWQMSFRALDDIKGSVRTAGLKTCQALASATVAWCTPQASPSTTARDAQAQAVVDAVVPFLVDKGVGSDAEDVRGFSMGLLLKLCKSSGRYLAPLVPAIVERLLESLSNMEAQAANYMTFHADSHGITQEQLESVRLSAVKSSPMMQGIETVLEYLTPASMAELVPKLQHIIRHGLGLPTRAGCARTVVVLCVKRPDIVRPVAPALVKAISGSLAESSALQRQAWAAAIGYMAPMLSAGMFKSLLRHLERIYFERHGDEARGVAGQVLEQLAQRCPERLCESRGELGTASFMLFGCSDASEAIGAAFQSAWREYMLGLGGRLPAADLPGVLSHPLARVSDSNWACRVQSAKAIASVAQIVEREARAAGGAEQPGAAADGAMALAQAALPALTKAAQGRAWPGKEHVLGAIVDVCLACARAPGGTAEQRQALLGAACEAVLREMGQGEVPYRREVIKRYCALAEHIEPGAHAPAVGALLEIAESLGAHRGADKDGDIDMDDDDEKQLKRPQQLMLVATAIDALRLTLAKVRGLDGATAERACRAMHAIARAGVWNVRVASLECLAALLESCCAGGPAVDAGLVLDAVRACAAEGRYVAVRAAALGTLAAVLRAAAPGPSADARAVGWQAEAAALLGQFADDPAPSVADRAKELQRQR